MSVKDNDRNNKAIQAYLRLKARADAGDPRAKEEIEKLRAKLAVLVPPAQSSALARVPDGEEESEHDGSFEALDDEEDEVFGADDLDRAARIVARLPSKLQGDDLAMKAAIRRGKWTQLDKSAQFMRINPASVLHGTLGGQQDVQSGQKIQVVNWAGEDAETTPVTITVAPVQQLSSSPTEAVSLGTVFSPYAVVQFGTRGMMVKAEVDIGTGCQFTVGASAVTVEVAMEPATPPGSMRLAGMLSFFPVVRTSPITRSFRFAEIAQNASATSYVPPFAKRVWVQWLSASATITLAFYDRNGVLQYDRDYTLPAGATNDIGLLPVPLSGSIFRVDVINTSAAPITGALIYELSF